MVDIPKRFIIALVLILGTGPEVFAENISVISLCAGAIDSRPEKVKAQFQVHEAGAGFPDRNTAALAFYTHFDDYYLATDDYTELAGFLLRDPAGRFHFSNAVEVPASFELQAAVLGGPGWQVADFLHTHPGGNRQAQDFSETDRRAVLKSERPYFLRSPDGDMRYLDKGLARSTKLVSGASGQSVCREGAACLPAHPRYGKPPSNPLYRWNQRATDGGP